MSGEPLLSVRGLTRRFGGVVALDGLSFDLEPGRILGLIGPNGSGKTTFFNVLTGIYPAHAGELWFAGKPATNLAPQAVYEMGITRTFQRSRLCLPLTVFDNIALGSHGRLDHGLWFNLARRRALVSRPRLLLLDEPSAGMTHDETRRLMDEILEVRGRFGDLTIVLIEHEMSVIERATDRCVVLNYGKKLSEGTYAEVAADPLVRQAYLGLG